jgi:pimeloyl-ACP methyl ester carboxylesterase
MLRFNQEGINRMTLSYRMEGEGPAIVLIHGMGVTFTIWEQLAPLIGLHYKRILVELPGNGFSPAPPDSLPYYEAAAEALEELRSNLRIERWSVLGYSLGAWAARAYILRYPQRVEKAIMLCPGITRPLWAFNLRLLAQFDRRLPALGDWLLKSWRLHGLVRLFGFNGANPPEAAVWTREISSQPVEVIKAGLSGLPGAGQAPFTLPDVPVRFIWGDHDWVTLRPNPLRPVDCLVRGDHSAPVRNAPEVAKAILAFLEQQD